MRGSCLCGDIVYEVDSFAGPIGHCHCATCRKAHAAAYASTARVDRASFRWLQGQELLSSFESTPGKLRHFCRRCGSHLVGEWIAQPQVIVRVATLDEDPHLRPVANIWTSHDVQWLHNDAHVPSFEQAPPSR